VVLRSPHVAPDERPADLGGDVAPADGLDVGHDDVGTGIASRRAVAAPMPLAAPVTSAT
jgi:hypothetical protein